MFDPCIHYLLLHLQTLRHKITHIYYLLVSVDWKSGHGFPDSLETRGWSHLKAPLWAGVLPRSLPGSLAGFSSSRWSARGHPQCLATWHSPQGSSQHGSWLPSEWARGSHSFFVPESLKWPPLEFVIFYSQQSVTRSHSHSRAGVTTGDGVSER